MLTGGPGHHCARQRGGESSGGVSIPVILGHKLWENRCKCKQESDTGIKGFWYTPESCLSRQGSEAGHQEECA